jgi:hypothetical protein
MNIQRAVKSIIDDLVAEMERENQRLAADYNGALAFNKREQEKMDVGQIDEYTISDPTRPNQVIVKNRAKLEAEAMKFFNDLMNGWTTDPDIEGVEVVEYRTPAEIAAEDQGPTPTPTEGLQASELRRSPRTPRARELTKV